MSKPVGIAVTPLSFIVGEGEIQDWVLLGEWASGGGLDTSDTEFIQCVDYHWDDRLLFQKHQSVIDIVYRASLEQLARDLNDLHSENLPVRFWEISVGSWLGYFVCICLDRYLSLKKCAEVCPEGLFVVAADPQKIPSSTQKFISFMTEDEWNNGLFREIITLLDYPAIWLDMPISAEKKDYKGFSFISSFKNKIKIILNNFHSIRITGDFFFLNDSFSSRSRFWVFNIFNLGSLRIERKNIELEPLNCSNSLRERLKLFEEWSVPDIDKVEFFQLFQKMVYLNLPLTYVENFSDARKKSRVYSKSEPRFIYSENCFFYDDIFSLWAAEQVVARKAKLITGQHGGNFGISRYCFVENYQRRISDLYLAWGEQKALDPRACCVGISRILPRNVKPNKKAHRFLVVQGLNPRYSHHVYSCPISAGQNKKLLTAQRLFYESLPSSLQSAMRLKLYPVDFGYKQSDWWLEASVSQVICEDTKSMPEFLSESRLVVCTYNATTVLQTLTSNFPTVCYWDRSVWELSERGEILLDLLASCDVYHSTPEAAAEHVAKIWHNVDQWWYSSGVQEARREFCQSFAQDPVSGLGFAKILIPQLNKL